MQRGLWRLGAAVGLGLSACSSADVDITLAFPTEEARALTRVVSFTAIEPILSEPNEEPRFVSCAEISVFPPTQLVDPNEPANLPRGALAGVISSPTTQTFPLDGDWLVDLETASINEALNPWGAIMVYVDARGDARRLRTDGVQIVASTLVAGCFCVRTLEGSSPDITLDTAVKQACQPLDGEGSVSEQVVNLQPIVPEEFNLTRCDGLGTLTAPRGEVLSPGPRVCLEATPCPALQSPGTPCFRCEQPCSELDDQENAPILFNVFRGTSQVPIRSEVALTSRDGSAEALVDVGECAEPLRVEAQVVGRRGPTTPFEVQCVEPVMRFECPLEVALGNTFEAKALVAVPGDPRACRMGNRLACDKLVVVSDRDRQVVLQILDPATGQVLTSTTFDNEQSLDAIAYHYQLSEPGRPASRPVVAVATAEIMNPNRVRVRVLEWRFDGPAGPELVPQMGRDDALDEPCGQWLCGSLNRCIDDANCPEDEVCGNGACQLDDPPTGQDCEINQPPVYCECQLEWKVQDTVTLRSNDVDGDGLADLAVTNSSQLAMNFFYSGLAEDGALYTDNCVCGRFSVQRNTFGLPTLTGPVIAGVPPRGVDLVLGGQGLTVSYADRELFSQPTLRCFQPTAIGAQQIEVLDIQVAPLRCKTDDLGCTEYDEVLAVSSPSVNEVGVINVLSGDADRIVPSRRLGAGRLRRFDPRPLPDALEPPRGPARASVGDFNADRSLDFAVLYTNSQEVHVWLGNSNGGFGEISNGIALDTCRQSVNPQCPPMPGLAAFDSDGDGRDEIAVVCSPSAQPRVRIFSPRMDDAP